MANAASPAAGHRRRLRERFGRAGLEGFHDYEMVELLLTFAVPRRDVKPAAKELVRRFRGLKGVFEAPVGELVSVKGIGENAAGLLSLINVVASECLNEQAAAREKVTTPGDVVRLLGWTESAVESFYAVYLNSKNEVLGVELLSEGKISRMSVSPREAIEKAFKHNARSVIFVHRLADGVGMAAEMDPVEEELLASLQDAAQAIDIIVHDHIVAGGGAHLSARESGLLKRV